MAVTAIIVVVTGVVLANNGRFGGVVQLQNLAYDVALSIRQAQVYSISVQRYGTGTDDFSTAYGVHFETALSQNYMLFGDVDEDGFFDREPLPNGENVSPSPYTIRNGFQIIGLCAPAGSDATTCMNAYPSTQLDIVFKRPEADAYIRKNGQSGLHSSARIILRSPRNDVMSVVVENNGQISVKREASQ
ncbi:hypothetical protein A3C18_00555 [Candidatus Kaiserbacteria bacterium RIFCSPHIGHO2_02_FULL_54_11b]|uniref:General secretion pathway GspH domain-containing protein n=2 Tax=Candidatus Kaiseribacteriota TaxID=1752734 RepID=A0A1F6CMS3_9BACT|nr:MAG: hypothetical protein A2704_05730 [Candidatus Kaiserbacteria bacterium RIFCSPHIGHO2_01_FULL_54_36b]OGG65065.1 MAG: hypothetical protein A3C18_00555 [Candidatus Kaiserbacteria bacterium RIFCSPHIGHO2_02_FULL_54_11b]